MMLRLQKPQVKLHEIWLNRHIPLKKQLKHYKVSMNAPKKLPINWLNRSKKLNKQLIIYRLKLILEIYKLKNH